MQSVSKHLKEWYNRPGFHLPDDDEEYVWHLLQPEHFANELLIKHHKRRGKEEISKVASIMRRGLMQSGDWSSPLTDVFRELLRIQDEELYSRTFETNKISDIFKPIIQKDGSTLDPTLVLINGAPGMGKTTLCKEMAFQWAQGLLLNNNSLVFLLLLRDPGVQNISSLKHLIHYFYAFDPSAAKLSQQCAEILIKQNKTDITIILDGYDELSTNKNKNKKKLFVHSIVKQTASIKSKVVITSRPIASESLQNRANVTVELLGFTDKSKKSFIAQEFKDCPSKMEQLLSYLHDHDTINSACYMPIMLILLVRTFKEYDQLPSDEIELYQKFICLAMSRFLQKVDSNPPEAVLSIKELLPIYQNYLENLSMFAFEIIKLYKSVFTKKDVESTCSDFTGAFEKYRGMGLLNFVKYSSYEHRIEASIYYNFLHSSIQEYLASYYVNICDVINQFELLKRTFFLDSYMHTWIMFIRMIKSSMYEFKKILTYSHVLGASGEEKSKLLSIVCNLNLFEDLSKFGNITIENITGKYKILCYKENKQSLQKKQGWLKNLKSIDVFWFFKEFYNPFLKIDWMKLYLSVCSTVGNVDQLVEVYLIDKNTHETAYHDIIAELGFNNNLSVTLLNSYTLLAYRAKLHQIADALSMKDSLKSILFRDCEITNDIATLVSSYLRNDNLLKSFSVTHCRKIDYKALQLVLKALKNVWNLTLLDLSDNHMSEVAADELAQAISNNVDLEALFLQNNNFRSSLVIFEGLKRISSLRTLDLSGNNMTAAVAKDLKNVININIHLEVLRLGYNSLHSSIVFILQALRRNKGLKILDISGNIMSREAVDALADVINNNVCLETLSICDSKINHSSMTVILQALKLNSNLKELNLRGCRISHKVAVDLADVIKSNNTLEVLYLGGNHLQSFVCKILQALKQISTLRIIDLADSNLPEELVHELADVIKGNISLEVLALDNNKLHSSTVVILQALKRISTLKTLSLVCISMSQTVVNDLASVIQSNAGLQALCLGDNNLRSSATVILQALERISSLKVLDLSSNNMFAVPTHTIGNVVRNNSYLQVLDVHNNNLQLSVVVQALKENSNLKKLNFSGNKMSRVATDNLVDVIKNNNGLESVHLSGIKLQLSAVAVLQALKELSSLKELHLNGIGLSQRMVGKLAELINNNKCLEIFDIGNNNLQSSAIVILEALKTNTNLKKLNLNGNNMSVKVADVLANVIRCSSCLEALHLKGNNLQSSVGLILESLKRLSTLKLLDLGDNNLSGKVVCELVDVLKNNFYLEKLYLFNNNLQSSAVAILEALKDISTLKVLNLGNVSMSENTIDSLSDVIKNNVDLEELCLFKNNLQLSAIVILQALKGTSNLRKLDLIANNMTGIVVNDLADVIKVNPALEELWISGNNLQSSIVVILEVLKNVSNLKVLDLCNCKMMDGIACNLVDVIKNNIQLEELYLDSNNLQSSAIVILQALKGISKLKKLTLGDNDITGTIVDDLADVIRSNNCLEVLCLGNNNLGSFIVVILESLKTISTLKLLDLNGNHNMSGKAIDSLVAIIKSNINLEELYLHNSNLQSSAVVILQGLKEISNLKKLRLSGNSMTSEVVDDLVCVIKNNNRLEALWLSGNNLQSSVVVILEALMEISTLKLLHLGDNNMSGKTIDSLVGVIKKNTHLEELSLINNNLQTSAVKLLQALKGISNLKKLNLTNNNMTGKAVQDLADVIKNNDCLEELLLGENNLGLSVLVILEALKEISTLKSLNLSDNMISGGKVADSMAVVAKNNFRLEELHLYQNNLGSSAITILQALKQISNLKRLNLMCNNMTDKAVDDLADVVKSNIFLEELYLSGNILQSSAIVIFEALKDISTLNVLDLGFNNMSGMVADSLADVITNNVHLKELHLFHNNLGPSAFAILQALKQISNLRHLNLSNNNMTDIVADDLADVIKRNPTLEYLAIGANKLESSDSLVVIMGALKHLSNIKVLNLCSCKVLACDVADVIKANAQLEELYLDYNDLQLTAVVLLQALKQISNLKKLNLNGNNMTCRVVDDLAGVIKSNYHLEVLCIRSNNLQSSAITIFENLKRISTLRVLDVDDNNMSEEVADSLADVIKNNVHLEELHLSDNKLRSSVTVILQALKQISNLKKLNLNDNSMTCRVVGDLTGVIKSNYHLEVLRIRGNNLQSSAITIFENLKRISTLRVLDLDDNNMSEEVADSLADVIKNNVHLEELHLSDNKLQSSITVILQALKQISNLKKLNLNDNSMTCRVVGDLAGVIKSNYHLEVLRIRGNNLQSSANTIFESLKIVSTLTLLDLDNNNMSDKVADTLANVIKNNVHLEQLHLCNNNLQSSVVLILYELKRLTNFKQLNLSGNNMTSEVVDDLADVITSNTSLEGLGLCGNKLHSSAFVVFEALKGTASLKALDFGKNDMSEEVVKSLADVIKNSIHLEQLRLFNNNLQFSAVAILQALKGISSIKKLHLGGNNMTGEVVDDLAGVIKNNTNLEALWLSGNNLQSSVTVIIEALKENSSLKLLDLSNNNIPETLVNELTNAIKNGTVNLEQHNLGKRNLAIPVHGIKTIEQNGRVQRLDISHINITEKVANDLANVISNNPQLEEIIIGSNVVLSSTVVILQALKGVSNLKVLHWCYSEMLGKTALDLADVIKNNANLEELDLCGNNLQSSAGVILQALQGISKLKKLNVYSNNMTGKVADDLAGVVKSNTCLEALWLGDNNLMSSTIVVIEALKQLSTLKLLDLSVNNMSQNTAVSLSEVIKHNIYLKEIYLIGNNLQSSASFILQALKHTSNLKKLYMDYNNMTGKMADHLASVIKNNNRLEILGLRCNNLQSSAILIFEALKEISTLKLLYLDDNNMSGKVADSLADVIKSNIHLEELLLCNNNLQSSAVTILQALRTISNLKKLNLSYNNMTDKVVDDLAGVVKSNTGIEMLYLDANNLKSSAVVIFEALKEISTLKVLHLNDNNMSGKVADGLADVIKNNVHLEELHLNNNNLQSSAVTIIRALKGVSNLKKLSLDYNNMSGKVSGDLAGVVEKNTFLEELHLCGNNLQLSADLILKALKGISTLKILNLDHNNMSKKLVDSLADVIKNNVCLENLCLDNNHLYSSAIVILQALKRTSNLKILALSDNHMSPKVAHCLADVIKINRNLAQLALCNNNLQSSVSVILKALKGAHSLLALDLHDNNMSRTVVSDLVSVFNNNALQCLAIGGNDIQTSLPITTLHTITLLFLCDNNLTIAAVEGLVAMISRNTELRQLRLGGNIFQHGLLTLTKVFKILPNLEMLELSRSSCSVTNATELAHEIGSILSLKSLMFSGVVLSSYEFLCVQFFDALQTSLLNGFHNDSERLEVVSMEMQQYLFSDVIKIVYSYTQRYHLFSTEVTIYKFVYAIRQCLLSTSTLLSQAKLLYQKLSKINAAVLTSALHNVIKQLIVLDLQYSNIGKHGASTLADALHHNEVLEQLWLRGNVLCDEGAAVILNSLQNLKTLKVLDLSYNCITSDSSDGIAAVINSNNSLEQLWLGGNHLLDTGIAKITKALKILCRLRLLSLFSNGITGDAAEDISIIISNNTCLEDLMLGNNQIQYPGFCKFVEALFNLQSYLRKLNMCNALITEECAVLLALIFKNCENLQELYLGNNMLGTKGVIRILRALRNICTLRVLTLSNNNITKEAASSICDVITIHYGLNILLVGGNDLQTDGVLQIAETVRHNEGVQMLAVCENGVDELIREAVKIAFSGRPDLHLYV